MSAWADNLRKLIECSGSNTEEAMHEWLEIGESQLEHAHNTIECLVEANAALREQLCDIKHSRRSGDKPIALSTAPKEGHSAGEALAPLGPKK